MITTEGKTLVQVLVEVAGVLVAQGEQCVLHREYSGDTCMYQNEKGNHCAVGFLLPENEKLLTLEANVTELVDKWPELLGDNEAFIRDNRYILSLLQDVHDSNGQGSRKHSLEIMLREFEGVEEQILRDVFTPWVELGAK